MKKRLYSILLGLSLLFIWACGKCDINGGLDGMWHLRTVEDLTEDTIFSVKGQCIYYSIQLHLITLKRLYGKDSPVIYEPYIGRFIHTRDSLTLYDFRVFQNESISATAENLAPFYLDGTISNYAIEELNDNRMVLSSGQRILTFKKF